VAQQVVMPQMGESIAEGTVTQWLKKIGDHVDRDEPLFEISTDKVDAEIPSPASGVLLEIKVQPGQTVPVNTVVAVVGDSDEANAPSGNGKPVHEIESRDLVGLAPEPREKAAAEAIAKTAQQPEPLRPEGQGPMRAEPSPRGERSAPAETAWGGEAQPSAAAASSSQPGPSAAIRHVEAPALASAGVAGASVSLEERRRSKSSPVVRKIASEHGVDLSALEGSGIGGRVTKDDILSYLERGKTPVIAPTATARAGVAATPSAFELRSPVPEAYRPRVLEGDRIEEMSTMRSKIAEHMVLSRRISAHVQTVWEVDATRIVELRAKHKERWREQNGVTLTYTGFLMKAAVDALQAYPVVNASVDGNRVIYHRRVNLGIAVALDWGLIVPVIRGADELNLLGLQRRANDLAERARVKKLKPDEVQDGTFSITNPGVFGSLFGLPVISQPQVAIMGVGVIEKRPVVVDDMIGIRSRLYLSLSFDHRIVDGATADRFMAEVKKSLESFPETSM
jgi:pyruvate dehydrogenase E2 component (dihydrolipoamide acetyltransferase)